MSEHFDPSEQETKELLPTNDTPESAHCDTNADPEGVARSIKASIVMPDHVNYRLMTIATNIQR